MRLIDADALRDAVPKLHTMMYEQALEAIDAAPMVRCEECAKYSRAECSDERLARVGDDVEYPFLPPTGFGCRYFEKGQK